MRYCCISLLCIQACPAQKMFVVVMVLELPSVAALSTYDAIQ